MPTKTITAINKNIQKKANVRVIVKSRRAQKNHIPKSRAKKRLYRKRRSKRKRQTRRKKPNDVYQD